jgi:hypothetical protein
MDVACWALFWSASAAALFVVEVVADAALSCVATALSGSWVPEFTLGAKLWDQFALAGVATEVQVR